LFLLYLHCQVNIIEYHVLRTECLPRAGFLFLTFAQIIIVTNVRNKKPAHGKRWWDWLYQPMYV